MTQYIQYYTIHRILIFIVKSMQRRRTSQQVIDYLGKPLRFSTTIQGIYRSCHPHSIPACFPGIPRTLLKVNASRLELAGGQFAFFKFPALLRFFGTQSANIPEISIIQECPSVNEFPRNFNTNFAKY